MGLGSFREPSASGLCLFKARHRLKVTHPRRCGADEVVFAARTNWLPSMLSVNGCAGQQQQVQV